jgi:ribose/xylose/arabinose/galactoside ABC-type transport system permease subunit
MGILNGAIISYLSVPAIIATLGTSTLFEGICLNLTRGGSVAGYPKEFFVIGTGDIFGIPIPLIVFAAVAVIFSLILQRTSWGEKIYMVGSNPTAAMYAGINNRAMLFGTYILSGLLSGTAGIIIISRYNSAKADHGVSYLLQTVAASVLGGVSIAGGFGKVSGVVIAVAIIQLVTTGFNILGISKLYTDIVVGLILIGVLAFGRLRVLNRKKRNKVVTG